MIHPLKIKEFSSTEAETIEISLIKNDNIVSLAEIHLPVLYPHGRPISKKKFDDLQDLMEFLPEYRSFYDKLKFDKNAKDEI